ncbi:uncharacterized protein BDZ99DRAFT_432017 [Mytilinidion resinicola]|uniref:Zn(2)-C6 fungal-type domain-containing protein n=1 Tax=Mytilinidion resinicola TaxID=574789 RepID=A0A6A6Z9K2_9PEZI|nr:uncharacterized protein BDZ99DRAFT_432017 [Mytilinidion resinicola]KAF2817710.1 hypothetical protein BDZ99DRAFT_432017 [Mytilinidion resinicola]
MPGILPMKVIKVGSSAQARIAQACDRCRSKKIRCDGIRPSCSQCVNVGFECKTSDKLSRRAFPRGYTESLEERVRALEAEVRELKDLLDEKDEKIDIPEMESREETVDKEDVFKVQQSPLLLDDENCDSFFVGTSSGRTLIDAFKHKMQESGRLCADISSGAFFGNGSKESASNSRTRIVSWNAPPRLVSDQMINIFFQEWAPLFPVLHRPTFLHLYEKYVASPESMTDKKSIAQLNLVFGIAALSSDSHEDKDFDSFESQWQSALDSFLMDNCMQTLQCLILAQIHSLLRSDFGRLLKYKGLAVSLAQRLGLHQSQKRFALGALTSETRKKVFWTLYTIDCFSAAHLGLPKLLREEDVECEYPADADDEYVTEKGFLPTLPGEFTKLSSALALFRVTRVLAKTLQELYPASASHEISFRALTSLADELEDWLNNLAPHLRLHFQQDKPSTNVTSSRSPILSLAYHHIRSLVYRPAVLANIGDRGSSALVAVADSSKSIVQIVQLLDERNLSFSFCLNRNEILVQAGFGLLFQTLNLNQDGKLMKDCQRTVCSVIEMLDRNSATGAADFRRVGCSMVAVPRAEKALPITLSRHNSEGSMPAPADTFRATQKHLKAIASRFTPKHSRNGSNESRRATLASITPSMTQHTNQSSSSISSIRSEQGHARSEPTMSPLTHRSSIPTSHSKRHPSASPSNSALRQNPNLDYLSFAQDPLSSYPFTATIGGKSEVSPTDWERLLSSLDNGQTNIYDTIYGGPPVDGLLDVPHLSAGAEAHLAWAPGVWGLGDVGAQQPPQSVLSFSDESLTSGEDFGNCEFGTQAGGEQVFHGIMIPETGLDRNYGI